MATNQTSKKPLGEAMKKETKGIWLVVGMRLAENSAFYLYSTFSVVYIMKTFGAERANQGTMSVLIASGIGVFAVPLWAILSDKIGRKPLYLFGSIGGLLFFPLYFVMTDTGSALLATLAIIIGLAVFHNSMYGPQAAFFAELFSTKLRYSGASMGYQFGYGPGRRHRASGRRGAPHRRQRQAGLGDPVLQHHRRHHHRRDPARPETLQKWTGGSPPCPGAGREKRSDCTGARQR